MNAIVKANNITAPRICRYATKLTEWKCRMKRKFITIRKAAVYRCFVPERNARNKDNGVIYTAAILTPAMRQSFGMRIA